MEVFTPSIKPVLLRLMAETHFSYLTRSVRSYLHLTQVYLTSINAVFYLLSLTFQKIPCEILAMYETGQQNDYNGFKK